MFEVLFNFVGNLEGLRQAFGKAAEMERQAASQQDGNFRKMQSAQERAAQSLAALDKVKLANQTRINELRQKEINIENNIAQIREKVSRYAQQRGVDSTGAPVGLNPNTLKQLDVQRQQHAAVQNEIRAIESRNRLIDESSRKVITYRDNVAAAQRAYTANQQAQARRSAEGAAYLGINTPTPDRNGFYNAAQLGQLEKAQTEQTTATRASVEQQRRDIARLRTEHADAINQQIADLRRLDDSIYQNMLAHKRASEVSAEAARQETAARSQLAQAESKIGASVFTAQLAQVQQRRDAALVARREAKTQLDEITKQLNEAESNFKAKVEPMQAKGTPAESIAADSEVKYLQQQVTLLREKRQAAVASVNAANESVKAVDAESKAVRNEIGGRNFLR
jgi:hypothetical protein